ncbi:MAG: molecular chaperone TorD family protein [Oscillospiraceae bacterium]|nr:molecular chaperone TorD family protein [Oscillospiraceae bacterium]
MLNLSEQRAGVYAFLSRLFKVEVDADTYARMKEARFPVKTGDDKIDAGYRAIAKYLSNDHDDPLLELAVDYARIFIGHGNTAYSAAYPFESVYTSETRLLMQAAYDDMLAVYAEAGLAIDSSWKDPVDHIGLELEYMQIMCQRAASALAAENDDEAMRLCAAQKDFLLAHLTNWVPMMTSDMRRFAKTDLYQGLSLLTEGFLRQEKDFLKELVVEA